MPLDAVATEDRHALARLDAELGQTASDAPHAEQVLAPRDHIPRRRGRLSRLARAHRRGVRACPSVRDEGVDDRGALLRRHTDLALLDSPKVVNCLSNQCHSHTAIMTNCGVATRVEGPVFPDFDSAVRSDRPCGHSGLRSVRPAINPHGRRSDGLNGPDSGPCRP